MTLTEQFTTMIAMVLMGIWLGIALATYHRFIHPRKKWHWLMIITDVIFWVAQGLFIFLVLLNVNQGEIRFYIFLALGCGYAAYKGLLEAIYVHCLEGVIQAVVTVGRFLQRIISLFFVQPAFGLLKLLYGLGKIIGRIILIILLFFLSVIIFPFKFLFRLLIPTAWVTNTHGFFIKIKDFFLKWYKKLR